MDIFAGRLAKAVLEGMEHIPETERDLPIVFNEYCTTWGNPSHENICSIVEAIKEKGFGYFVIDCGWYKEKDVPWDISMGAVRCPQSCFPMRLIKLWRKSKKLG